MAALDALIAKFGDPDSPFNAAQLNDAAQPATALLPPEKKRKWENSQDHDEQGELSLQQSAADCLRSAQRNRSRRGRLTRSVRAIDMNKALVHFENAFGILESIAETLWQTATALRSAHTEEGSEFRVHSQGDSSLYYRVSHSMQGSCAVAQLTQYTSPAPEVSQRPFDELRLGLHCGHRVGPRRRHYVVTSTDLFSPKECSTPLSSTTRSVDCIPSKLIRSTSPSLELHSLTLRISGRSCTPWYRFRSTCIVWYVTRAYITAPLDELSPFGTDRPFAASIRPCQPPSLPSAHLQTQSLLLDATVSLEEGERPLVLWTL